MTDNSKLYPGLIGKAQNRFDIMTKCWAYVTVTLSRTFYMTLPAAILVMNVTMSGITTKP